MKSEYTLQKIKFRTENKTWERAVGLYEEGKVKNFQEEGFFWEAEVRGTQLYRVAVSKKDYTQGDCPCYLGQNEILCKHMIAVAIYGLKKGEPLTEGEKALQNEVKFSQKTGELSKEEWSLVKEEISQALCYIKPYRGPSRIWFNYQDDLTEGCNRLAAVFSKLPASSQTADLVIKILLQLDKKLAFGGVDDSDGTVCDFIEASVELLRVFAWVEPECRKAFSNLKERKTSFGWEESLLRL